ncbi:MAG TPA: hypothetical protein VGO00_27175, partial [Kofleriaceae bacterium]|nr:hypothetical protein [Kofleriaceae bacterium]
MLVIAFVGCVPTPSQEFVCHRQSDCKDGRVCEDSFCVLVDAGQVADAASCDSFMSKQFAACQIPMPVGALDLEIAGLYTYDTDFATFVDPTGATMHPPDQIVADARLISVDELTIAAGTTLRV